MADRKGFSRKETIYFALVLFVSLISLIISVGTLFLQEYRYSILTKKTENIEKKTAQFVYNEDYDVTNVQRNYVGK